MGLGKRIVRQSIRAVTPRPIQKAAHPVRTAKTAVTPDVLLQAKLTAIDLAHPVGAVENAAIRAVINAPKAGKKQGRKGPKPAATSRPAASAVSEMEARHSRTLALEHDRQFKLMWDWHTDKSPESEMTSNEAQACAVQASATAGLLSKIGNIAPSALTDSQRSALDTLATKAVDGWASVYEAGQVPGISSYMIWQLLNVRQGLAMEHGSLIAIATERIAELSNQMASAAARGRAT